MKVVLVYNPSSGGSFSLANLKKEFANASIGSIDSIKLGAKLKSSLKRHIQQKEVIAVVGGDGSISAVASLLANTDATLMPLPGGTLNHFTKDLGIPQSLPDALKYFKAAKKVKIDTGLVGDKVFINNSSIGIYSDSLFNRDKHQKRLGKWPAVVTAAFLTLVRFRTYTVTLDGKTYTTPLLFVGNNLYEPNGFSFERSRLDEGLLSVYMVLGSSRSKLFWAALSLALGKKNAAKTLKTFQTTSVIISTHRVMRVSRDGEHDRLASPLQYKIQKSSLTILKG